MRLLDVFRSADLDPQHLSVVLHKSTFQPLRRLFPALVFERPDLFEAYQSVHSDSATASLLKRPYLASFIPLANERMLFVGLFEIVSPTDRPTIEIYADPRFRELEQSYGAADTGPEVNIAARSTQVVFGLRPMNRLADLRGRLQINTPPGRTYVRLAQNMDVPIAALTDTPINSPPPPTWRQFIVSGMEMRNLPRSWREDLRKWCGVYLITDQDGARYVGSAYGQENLFGRWFAHVAGDVGVTVELGQRDPSHFRFSILELLSPTATLDEVIAAENSWKERLHTRTFGLNKN